MDWVDELRPEKCLFRGLPNQKHSQDLRKLRKKAICFAKKVVISVI